MNRQQLIEDNMNLVYFIIHRYYPKYSKDEDIIQCGMLGLCSAAERFDEKKGTFSTFACSCINSEICKEFKRRKKHKGQLSLEYDLTDDEGGKVTLGDLIGEDDASYLGEKTFYYQLTADEKDALTMSSIGFSTEEIAKLSGFSVQKVRKLLRIINLKWRNFYGD